MEHDKSHHLAEVPNNNASASTASTLQLASSTTNIDDLINYWISRLEVLCNSEAHQPELKIIWIEALTGIPVVRLDRLFRRLEQTFIPTMACPFPMPGQIRMLYETERAAEADTVWITTVETLMDRYHPDIGWKTKDPPHWPIPIWKALDAAGGLLAVFNASEKELRFLKRDFVTTYLRSIS